MDGRVRSKDGTSIAYSRSGSGPAVILVTGSLDDGTENEPLAEALSDHFTVINYARRGRGESGDTLRYAIEREIEDIEALIEAAGGTAHLYGVSSGGALVVEAAARGVAANRIAVYEIPYDLADETPGFMRSYRDGLEALLAEGRRGDALALFMEIAGSSAQDIAEARASSLWPGLEELAPTLAYDAAVLGDGRPPLERLAAIRQPALIATGGGSPSVEAAADAMVAALPSGRRLVLENQPHVVDPGVMAAALIAFFGESEARR